MPSTQTTGPKTKRGKRRSSRNAVDHGLRSTFFFMSIPDNHRAYRRINARLYRRFQPSNLSQRALLRRFARAVVRREAVLRLENEAFAQERFEWLDTVRRLLPRAERDVEHTAKLCSIEFGPDFRISL
jgi:predicted RecB family nuclease